MVARKSSRADAIDGRKAEAATHETPKQKEASDRLWPPTEFWRSSGFGAGGMSHNFNPLCEIADIRLG
jgi:hypothetical protein